MKLAEQFTVAESAEQLWKVLDQPELVASCMPGMESVEVIQPDDIRVTLTQAIGPMSATFEARVRILERIDGESIRFAAVGKSVRGAVGTVRATNTVSLTPAESGTLVTLDADLALAGALGSVGQKVVGKQASRVTAEFAENLRRLLAAETPGADTGTHKAARGRPAALADAQTHPARQSKTASVPDRWALASLVMSAASAAVGIAILIRLRKLPR